MDSSVQDIEKRHVETTKPLTFRCSQLFLGQFFLSKERSFLCQRGRANQTTEML